MMVVRTIAEGSCGRVVSNIITAAVTLAAVTLGSWLSGRNQHRERAIDHARQWRDIRLASYVEFVSAYRNFVAFAVDPDARITAAPHPSRPGDLMPIFEERGRAYKEKLEATRTAARLLVEREATAIAISKLTNAARHVAAARADSPGDVLPAKLFDELWNGERTFLVAARRELGLPEIKLTMLEEMFPVELAV